MKNEELIEAFQELRPFLKIAHHISGRIRLRVSVGAVYKGREIDTKKVEALLFNMHGIKMVRLNRVAGSAAITYDPSRFSPSLWEFLLTGDEQEVAAEIRDRLQVEQTREEGV